MKSRSNSIHKEPKHRIRQMRIGDYLAAYALWMEAGGMGLNESDSREGIELYLRRNRGFCFVAYVEGRIVGTLLCGHDGRRGILRHLAVEKEFRRLGIAREMIGRALFALGRAGIRRCNTYVYDANAPGRRFWDHMGWRVMKDDFRTMQTTIFLKGGNQGPLGLRRKC